MAIFQDPRNFLSHPLFYSLFENSVGAVKFRRRFCAEWVGNSSNDRVLDAGCGTSQILEFLDFKEYTGIDESFRYIEHAKKIHAGNVRFEQMDILSADLTALGIFDLVLALGFFHHLPDPALTTALQKIRRVLRPGARLVSFDPCYHKGQGFFSKQLVSMDRGRYVRPFERYVEIARGVFPDIKAELWTGRLRIPYSHCVMEMK